MTDTITFAQVLIIAPKDEALPEDILGRLEHAWGELPAAEIGTMTIDRAKMATSLLAILPDPAYTNDIRVAVVEALGRLLERFNLVPVEPTQPLEVVFAKTPDQMDLRELLEALVADPSRYHDLRTYIERHHRVQRPSQRAKGLWVIPGLKSGIDVDLTMDYVVHLTNQFSVVQTEFRGRRPVSLERALGINNRALIHPFTGKPVQGPDENGFDLSQLSDELHEALLWAAVTGHNAWPQQIGDLYGLTEQLFQQPLATRWQRIVADYVYAKQSGDDLTRIISRYWPENIALQGVLDLAAAFGRQPSGGGGVNFRRLVEDAGAMNGALEIDSRLGTYRGGVYNLVDISGRLNQLDGVVILSGGQISGRLNKGTLLLPPGVRVSISGRLNEITQQNMSWEELAHYLKLV